jgi:hypothetical protein
MRSLLLLGLASTFALAGCAAEAGPIPSPSPSAPSDPATPVVQTSGSASAEAPTTPIASPRLYVAGGDNAGRPESTVWSVPIASDGTLGEWRSEHDLPAARTGHALVSTGRELLVIGGREQASRAQREIFGAPLELGHVGDFREVGALDLALASAGVTSSGSTLFVVGGMDSDAATSLQGDARYATLEAGVPGDFATAAPLPSARARFAAANVGPYVFSVGGETATGATDEVLVGRAGASGKVERWDAAPSLPSARVDHGVAAAGDHLYVLGGAADDGHVLDEVLVSVVDDSGSAHGWRAAASLPRGRSAHCVAVSGTTIYVVGGSNADGPLADVLVASSNMDGSLTPWRFVTRIPAPRAHAGCAVR